MYILRSLLIPLACILCLILAWYLMNDADSRFERERVGRVIELPSENAGDLRSGDRAQMVSGDPSLPEMPVDPSKPEERAEPAESDESSERDVPPSSKNGKSLKKPSAMQPSAIQPSAMQPSAMQPASEESTSSPMQSVSSEQSINSSTSEPHERSSGPSQSPGNRSVGKVDSTSDSIVSKPVATDSPSTLLPLLLNRASQSTVRFDRKDGSLLGCGVIVSTSIHGFDVLTANHLFSENELFSITTFDRDSVEGAFSTRSHDSAQVIKRSAAMDLALVRVRSVIVPVYTASLAEPGKPEALPDFSGWVVYCEGAGAPTSNKVSRAEKTTARRTKDAELTDYWKIERESIHGASGSGLFDDQGQLVGIASGNSRGFAYYSHANGIAKFLKD